MELLDKIKMEYAAKAMNGEKSKWWKTWKEF